MKRSEAISILKNRPYDINTINQEISFVANKLGVTTTDLNNFFKLPKRTYKDFKNQELLYDLGSKVMQKLNLQRGGKR